MTCLHDEETTWLIKTEFKPVLFERHKTFKTQRKQPKKFPPKWPETSTSTDATT